MLTRPGSTPGSGWMRDLSERLAGGPADPSGFRSLPRRYWLSYIALMVMMVVVGPMTFRQVTPPELPVHESSTRIAGFPPVRLRSLARRHRGRGRAPSWRDRHWWRRYRGYRRRRNRGRRLSIRRRFVWVGGARRTGYGLVGSGRRRYRLSRLWRIGRWWLRLRGQWGRLRLP